MTNKLSENVLKFTAGNEERKEGYAKGFAYFEASRTNKATAQMHKDMNEFLFEEIGHRTGKETQYILENFTRREVREAAFEVVGIMIDAIMPDVIMKDFSWLAEVRNIGWGDSAKFTLKPNDMFVSSKIGKTKRTFDIQMMHAGEKTLMAEWHGITVGVNFYDVLIGRVSLAEWMTKALTAMETEMRYEIYDAFATAMDNLQAPWSVQNFTQDSAIDLVQKVSAWNGGAEAVFLGTKLALNKIMPATTANTVVHVPDRQLIELGYFKEFAGVRCIELPQIADLKNVGMTKLPNDRIYVICPDVADKIVKVVLEGSTLTNMEDTHDGANLISAATAKKSWGIGVITSVFGGIIKL